MSRTYSEQRRLAGLEEGLDGWTLAAKRRQDRDDPDWFDPDWDNPMAKMRTLAGVDNVSLDEWEQSMDPNAGPAQVTVQDIEELYAIARALLDDIHGSPHAERWARHLPMVESLLRRVRRVNRRGGVSYLEESLYGVPLYVEIEKAKDTMQRVVRGLSRAAGIPASHFWNPTDSEISEARFFSEIDDTWVLDEVFSAPSVGGSGARYHGDMEEQEPEGADPEAYAGTVKLKGTGHVVPRGVAAKIYWYQKKKVKGGPANPKGSKKKKPALKGKPKKSPSAYSKMSVKKMKAELSSLKDGLGKASKAAKDKSDPDKQAAAKKERADIEASMRSLHKGAKIKAKRAEAAKAKRAAKKKETKAKKAAAPKKAEKPDPGAESYREIQRKEAKKTDPYSAPVPSSSDKKEFRKFAKKLHKKGAELFSVERTEVERGDGGYKTKTRKEPGPLRKLVQLGGGMPGEIPGQEPMQQDWAKAARQLTKSMKGELKSLKKASDFDDDTFDADEREKVVASAQKNLAQAAELTRKAMRDYMAFRMGR